MDLRGSLEENILTLLCTSDRHAATLLLSITPDLFSTRSFRKIAERAFKHIEKYGKAPGPHLRDLLEEDLRRGEEGIMLGKIVSDVEQLGPSLQADYVLSQLERFIRTRKLAMAIEEAADALQQGDIEGAEEKLYIRSDPPAGTQGIWLHDPEQALRFMDRKEDEKFSSGIDILDARGVVPARKQLFLWLGSKKIGKSWALIQAGRANIMARKSVLHITLEMDEDVTAMRYVQCMFAMSKQDVSTLRTPIFKKDQLGRATGLDFDVRVPPSIFGTGKPALAKRLLGLKNRARLKIKEFPMSSLTIANLNAYLDHLDRNEDFRPDLIIIDYAKIMKLDVKDMRISAGLLVEQLRGIGSERNCAMMTAWQGNRETENAKTVTSGMIAEAWSLTGTVDHLVTISKTSAERQRGLARLLLDASRHVEDKWLTMITQSYATGQFCIDSVYMSKFLEAEITRSIGDEEEDEAA